MKKLLLPILLSISSLVDAKDLHITLLCKPPNEMIPAIIQTYGEKPFMALYSKEENSNSILLVNPDTKTWTMILVKESKNLACILESGQGLEFVSSFKE